MRIAIPGLLAAAFAAAPALADPMTDRDIAERFVDQPITWWQDGGFAIGALHLAEDGRAMIVVDRPRGESDVGRWYVNGGRLCTVWQVLRQATEKCYSIDARPDGTYATSGGNIFRIDAAGT